MKNLFSFFALFLLLNLSSFAQDTHIQGFVKDVKGNPVAAATIMLLQGETVINGAITDDKGFYLIAPVDSPAVNLHLIAEYLTSKTESEVFSSTEKVIIKDFKFPTEKDIPSYIGCGYYINPAFQEDMPSGFIFDAAETSRMAGFRN
jgi:hypothetical protein